MAARIERKVQTFTGAGVVSALIIWAITTWVPGFETGVPEPVVHALNWVVPLIVGFLGAYFAKHTVRPGIAPRHAVVADGKPGDGPRQPRPPGHGGDDRP